MVDNLAFLSDYSKDLPWLKESIVFLTVTGSKAYGTDVESSDTDYRGICVPPKEYFFGLKKLEQVDKFKGVDCTVFNVQKFVSLAIDCNPNIIETLYTSPSDVLIMTEVGEILVENRDLFLSKRARFSFSGYCFSQLKRIKNHYKWLKSPPDHKPTREEFGLTEKRVIPKDQFMALESLLKKKMEDWNPDFKVMGLEKSGIVEVQNVMERVLNEVIGASMFSEDLWKQAAVLEGLDTNFIELVDKEKKFKSKTTEWDQYMLWIENRNEQRASLEAKFGYDTKHAGHIVRLMRMCREILESGDVIVKRPDCEEIKSIRRGSWTFEQLIEWIDKQELEMEALYKASQLKKSPDIDMIDKLLVKVVERAHGQRHT